MLRLNIGSLIVAALLSVALAACGGVRVPVQQSRDTAPAAEVCDRDRAGPDRVVVCRGDTLIGIANRENVSVANLMKVNGLRNDRILAGSVLILPDEYVYEVQPGDTLLDVSRATGVPVKTLIAANGLTDPNRLLPTSKLAIPRSETQMASASRRSSPQPMLETPAPQAEDAGPPVQTPSVTIGKPRRSAPPSPETPSPEPDISSPAPSVPASPETVGESPPAPAPSAKPEEPPAAIASTVPQPRPRAAEPAERPSAAEPSQQSQPEQSTPQTATPAASSFILPAEGKILSDFGPKSGGLHNDGINIGAPRGTAIRATADGSVAYAGDGLPGFGNLILIKHADGWTSAYAHADTMAVKRGDSVRQGQTIGTVGDTGSVSQPQLHFELRQHDRAIDPTELVR